jgi:hypothetical protein
MDARHGCIKNDRGELVVAADVIEEGEVVSGHETVKAASAESVYWFARGLGCARLRVITRMPGGGRNVKTSISITAGDPDDALFYVPERYDEVPPSTFYDLNPASPEIQKLDRGYFARRPSK